MGLIDSVKSIFSKDVKVPDSVPEELKEQVKSDLKNKNIDNKDVQTEFNIFDNSLLENNPDIVVPEEVD